MPAKSPNPRLSPWIVLAMVGMVAIPAGIALHTVRVAGTLQIPSANPTPRGYTWSLLLFLVPIAAIGGWLLPSEGIEVPRRAFWRTIGILTPLGCALDFFFAHRFFVYPNAGATLGIGAPALGGPVPVEEYVFYFTGFLAVLLLYLWLGEYWLAAYSEPDIAQAARRVERLVRFHPASAVLGAVLIVLAVAYKKLLSPEPEGFPGYLTFLIAGALVPSAMLFPVARRFINWRALSATMLLVALISLIWEATLAVPYGWWGFQPQAMVGVFIGAWAGLPVEEVLVWIAVTWATVIVYEVVRVGQAPAITKDLASKRAR
jgi:lycopene cyclase domain-containing protein